MSCNDSIYVGKCGKVLMNELYIMYRVDLYNVLLSIMFL